MAVVTCRIVVGMLLAAGAAVAADGEPIAPGGSLVGTLPPPGPEATAIERHRLDVDAPGWITVSLASYDFDAAVALLDESGRRVAEDADGGLHTDAWLAFEASSAGRWVLEVTSADGRPGTYDLVIFAGREDRPDLGAGEAHAQWLEEGAELAWKEGRTSAAKERLEALLDLGNAARKVGDPIAEPTLLATTRLAAEMGAVEVEGRALVYRGALAKQQRNLVAAVTLFSRGLELLETLEDPDLAAILYGYEALGVAMLDMGALPGDAEEVFSGGERLARREGRPGRASRLRSRRARCFELMGDHERAETLHAEAVQEAVGTGQSFYIGHNCRDAGVFHKDRGHYARASELYEQALSHLDEKNPLWGAVKGDLADVYISLGRFAAARNQLEALAQRLDEVGNARGAAGYRSLLARLAFETGDSPEAARQLEAALAVYDGEERDALLVILGIVLTSMGEERRARARYEEVLDRIQGREGREGLESDVRINLARLLIAAGDPASGREHLYKALKLARNLEDVSLESLVRGNLAWAHRELGDAETAREQAEEARALAREQKAVGHELFALQILAWAALDQRDLDRVEVALQEAHGLLDREQVTSLSSMEAAGARSIHGGWGPLAQDLTACRLAGDPTEAERDAHVFQGFAASSRWKARALLESMVIGSRADVAPDVAALQLLLGASDALVEYAEGEHHLYAYVLENGALRFHDLGSRELLEGELAAFMADVSAVDVKPGGDLAGPASIEAAGNSLYARLLARLWPDGAVPGQLIVVPTPDLTRLPFAALVVEAADGPPAGFDDVTFLAERCRVTYGPSVGVLAALADTERRDGGRALLVGDAVYGAELARDGAELGASDLAAAHRLWGTRDEALDFAGMLPSGPDEAETLEALEEKRNGSMEAASFDLYLGEEASVDVIHALQTRGPEYSLLLFAVHGMVDARDPRRSGLLLSYEPETEGFVPLGAIGELELDADLAVVSSCVSARGPILRGEGVQSVARAFLESGTRGVVASLWAVDDPASHELMTRFARRYLVEGLPAAEALHRASLELRELRLADRSRQPGVTGIPPPPFGHPYYWAPFIYVGADL